MIIAGNWKLNKGPKQTEDFVQALSKIANQADGAEWHIYPSAFCIPAALDKKDRLHFSHLKIGAQNISEHISGAYTGENSAQVLKEMGADLALIGHSERRTLFGESDTLLAAKVKVAQQLDLKVCFCIGEKLEERQSGLTFQVLKHQVQEGLKYAIKEKDIIIAYEPVWAIGTGQVANNEQVSEAHRFIYETMTALDFKKFKILYGGSVKADNSQELSKIAHVDGFLIGGASLDVDSFYKIAKASCK